MREHQERVYQSIRESHIGIRGSSSYLEKSGYKIPKTLSDFSLSILKMLLGHGKEKSGWMVDHTSILVKKASGHIFVK